jgi:hypothetical protein
VRGAGVPDDSLHSLLRHATAKVFRFTFADGEEMLAEVISSSHVDEDDTVILLRTAVSVAESGWQAQLADIRSVKDARGHSKYERL